MIPPPVGEMPETRNVFIDTQVFHRYDYCPDSRLLEKLASLAQQDQIRVILVTITIQEIMAQIEHIVIKTHRALRKNCKSARLLKSLMKPPIDFDIAKQDWTPYVVELQQRFIEFLQSIRTHEISVNDVDPSKVFDAYFKKRPPFGEGKKKDEFPDAFAAAALEQWCQNNSSRVYVISEDGDWAKCCENSTSLIHVKTLEKFLSLFPDAGLASALRKALRSQREVIFTEVEGAFQDLAFWLRDLEGDVLGTTPGPMDYHTPLVIEAADGKGIAQFECDIEFKADITYEVPGTGTLDKEDGVVYFPAVEKGTATDSVSISALIQFDYDVSNLSKVNITDVFIINPKNVEVCLKNFTRQW